MTEFEQDVIDVVFDIRVKNNGPWKRLMEIAMEHAPEEAKAALREVNDNDQRIARWMRRITE